MRKMLAACSFAVLSLSSMSAYAWPDKAVTLVVPFPPGGSTDQVARAVSPIMTGALKQPVLIDNRPGATGTIGANAVSRAAPDGYTFLVTSLGPLVIVPHLMKKLPYDAQNDFDAITVAVQSPNVLVVPENSPHKSVADIIAYQKANPGRMTFASAGNGSSDHLTAELFWQQTGTKGLHIPYKGGAPAHTDLIGGQVDASFQNVNSVVQYINAGKMRALAVTSPKRSPVLPDVPTLAEAGVKNVEVASWQAVVAPKGLPPEILKQSNEAFVQALNNPKVRDQFTSIGFEIVANTPEQFKQFQQKEYARWKQVIEAGNISIE